MADGGSSDGTAELAVPLADRVLRVARGRALQMNAAARVARGEALVFLHADTRLPADAPKLICESLQDRLWGRFDVRLDGRHPLLRVIGWAMNLRSRLTGIATGDQAIFVRRADFPGFPEIPLMEDVAFSRSMRRLGPPACLRARVRASARRWEAGGVLRTIVLMWRLRLLYALGTPPERLARLYDDHR